MRLAHTLNAGTVVLSNPYRSNDKVMKKLCGTVSDGVTVICEKPAFSFVGVPREYLQTVAQFSYIFAYQVGGTLKALVQGECHR